MKKIPVKFGWELVIPFNVTMIIGAILLILEGEIITSLLVFLPIIVFFNYVIFSISYSIESHYFVIKSGLAATQKIDILNISKVQKTNDPTASAAPTLFGRLKIQYFTNTIIIAPKNQAELTTEFLKINPNITFKD